MAKASDFDHFLRGSAEPIIVGELYRDGEAWAAFAYAHNGVFARYLGTVSNSKYVVEDERASMIFQLMRRGANVIVCNSKADATRALKKWPTHVVEWMKAEAARTDARNRALSKLSK